MLTISPAGVDDIEFMWQMLFYASHSHHEPGRTLADIRHDPDLTRHVEGWGERAGDLGVIASRDGRPVGACWVRRLVGHEQADVTFVDDETPELVIAVEPDQIGGGVGTRLLGDLLERTDAVHVAKVVLTARSSNPAISLYERHGFDLVETIVNRVGTESVKMIRTRST